MAEATTIKGIGLPWLWESVADGLLVVEHGMITATNGQADLLFGWPAGALIGQPVECLVPPSIEDRHARWRVGFDSEPAERHMQPDRSFVGRRSDGSIILLQISLTPVPDRSGTVLASVRRADPGERREESVGGLSEVTRESLVQHLYAAGLGLRAQASAANGDGDAVARTLDAIEYVLGVLASPES